MIESNSGIRFFKDAGTILLAQAYVNRRCAVEVPPESLVGHGRIIGAWYGGPVDSYALQFEDGHEVGGFDEKWWTGRIGSPSFDADGAPVVASAAPTEPAAPASTEAPSSPAPPSVVQELQVAAIDRPVAQQVAAKVSAVATVRPHIVTIVPFEPDGDLGRLYNEHMRALGEDDWACFLDHDAVHTTRKWYGILEQAILNLPDAGLFGAMTNRVGSEDQELPGVDRNNHDMIVHRKIGLECADGKYAPTAHWPEYIDMDHPGRNWLAGVLMLTSKRAWRMAKATDEKGHEICGFQEGALFGVDNAYHRAQRAAGNKVYLLSRLYVYHWYRARGDDGHVQELAGRRSWRP